MQKYINLNRLILFIFVASLSLAAKASDTEVIATASFSGMNGHIAKGEATITQSNAGFKLVLSDDFEFDGAPDPRLGFATDEWQPGSEIQFFAHRKGRLELALDKNIALKDYQSLMIWCEKFSVPIGKATLVFK